MTINPAPANTGITFVREDLPRGEGTVAARYQNVVDTDYNTSIGNKGGARIATVEHLLAALSGCGIDNAVVEIDGPEVPAMDGSAGPFVFLIECAGVESQDALRCVIRILKTVEVRKGGRSARLSPADTFTIGFEIGYDNPVIGTQAYQVKPLNGAFKTELCQARTYGFAHEVEAMRAQGLARGGSLDNAVVISDDRVLNAEGLRFADEFVRHKILDAMGDLYLAGGPMLGRYDGTRAGHAFNHALLSALFADKGAWRLETAEAPAPEFEHRWEGAPAVATA